MKAPAVHPLQDMPVRLEDGATGIVVEVYPAIGSLPERAMVEINGRKGALPIVPVAKLRAAL